MGRIRWLVALVLAAVGVVGTMIVSTPKAYAYTCYYGGTSKAHYVRYVGINTTWEGGFDTARNRWNGAGVGAAIYRYDMTANTMTAGSYTDKSWYGLYTPGAGYTIQVNSYTLNNDAPSGDYWTWVLSTSTHELGHSLRLPDNPPTTESSLMKHSRNRSVVGLPTSYDRANVGACY